MIGQFSDYKLIVRHYGSFARVRFLDGTDHLKSFNKPQEALSWLKKAAKKCIVCKTEFWSLNSNAKYCSDECRGQLNESKHLRTRFFVLARDNFKWQYCGRSPQNSNCVLEVDHVMPRSKGGSNELSNLVTSCWECNHGKSDVLLSFNRKEITDELSSNE